MYRLWKTFVHAKRKIEMYSAAQWIEICFPICVELYGISYTHERIYKWETLIPNVIIGCHTLLFRYVCPAHSFQLCRPVRRSLNIRHNWIEIGRLVYCLLNEEDDYLGFWLNINETDCFGDKFGWFKRALIIEIIEIFWNCVCRSKKVNFYLWFLTDTIFCSLKIDKCNGKCFVDLELNTEKMHVRSSRKWKQQK